MVLLAFCHEGCPGIRANFGIGGKALNGLKAADGDVCLSLYFDAHLGDEVAEAFLVLCFGDSLAGKEEIEGLFLIFEEAAILFLVSEGFPVAGFGCYGHGGAHPFLFAEKVPRERL